jgi:broad specificity phosphatase PhoE
VTRRRLYLLRHGAVDYFADGRPVRPEDVVLTPEGREQALSAAAVLSGIAFDRVVTSGLPRTVETAQLVVPGVEAESWPDLREVESGRIADLDDAEAAFATVWRGVVPPETRFLGGETMGSLLDRVVPAVDRLVADEGWDAVLAVLHGGVIRAILSYALTGERVFLGNFELAPASISVLDVGDEDWVVRAVNVTPYDLAHQRTRLRTMEELWSQYRST